MVWLRVEVWTRSPTHPMSHSKGRHTVCHASCMRMLLSSANEFAAASSTAACLMEPWQSRHPHAAWILHHLKHARRTELHGACMQASAHQNACAVLTAPDTFDSFRSSRSTQVRHHYQQQHRLPLCSCHSLSTVTEPSPMWCPTHHGSASYQNAAADDDASHQCKHSLQQ